MTASTKPIHRSPRPSESEVRQAVEMLRQYFRDNPRAADTLGGIARLWWQRVRYETAQLCVEQALQELIREGVVEALDLPGGQKLFRSVTGPRGQEN